MQSYTVVLDACVLVPIAGTETLLRLAEYELYRPMWSERILDEAQRAVKKLHPDIGEDQIARRFTMMNQAFEDACVFGWESLEASIELPDIDDRHVVACAIRAGADAIVTENFKDFPASVLSPLGIKIVRFDDFLLDLLDIAPEIVTLVIEEQARDTQYPELTTSEVLDLLHSAHAPKASSAIRARLES